MEILAPARKIETVNVKTGQLVCRRRPVVYNCSGIGSCVVVFMYDHIRSVSGVVHLMLPASGTKFEVLQRTTYADSGCETLITNLIEMGASRERLKAKLIGGANLFGWANSGEMIELGSNNLRKVKEELIKHKIYIAAEEVGGNNYKSAKCYAPEGRVVVKMEFEKTI